MELKVKGKFVTSSKVKIFQNSSCHILEKTNEIIIKNKCLDTYHDVSKIYEALKLCTVM